jgi:hypothetical protein
MKLLNTLYLMLVVMLMGAGSLSAQMITIGTGTNTNATTTASPINIWYRSLRYQTVYTAAELQAAGAAPGQILQLGWYVTAVPTYDLPNYTISMKNTTATDASVHDGTGLQQVYNTALYTPVAGGFDMLTLQTPFIWNGVDNLLIDVCFDQTNPTYAAAGQVRIYTATNGGRYIRSDVAPQCGLATTTTLPEKPHVQLFIQSGPAPTCSMVNNSVTATNVTANGATISWTPTNTPQYFLIEYGPTGFLPGTGTSDTTLATSYNITGLLPTTSYTARVRQVCGTAVGDTSYARVVNFETPCASALLAPFHESFETGSIECITTNSGPLTINTTNNTWGVSQGATSSLSTGPDFAYDGTYYAYLESSGTPNSTDIMLFNTVDLSALTTPTLSFWYHMYGATMGTMKMEVRQVGTTTWQEIFNMSGDQGNVWNFFSYSLAPYLGQVVQYRLTGIVGSSFTSDMAIDEIRIENAPANDASVTAILSPTFGACNQLTNSEFVTVQLANFGSATLTSASVTLSINGQQVATGVFNGSIPPNGTTPFTFPTPVNLTTPGQITISSAAAALPTDNVPWNNANSFIVYNDGNSIVSTFPYLQTFDNWNTCLADCLDGGCGGFGLTNGWTNVSGDDSDWSVISGATATGGTGPDFDHTSGTGKYLYTEAGGLCNDFKLLTPCFNFSNVAFPKIEFWYHMFGATTGTLALQADTTGTGNWETVWSLTGTQGNLWKRAEIPLPAYSGYVTKFRFVGTVNGVASDMGIDDFLARSVPPHDLQITYVDGPDNDCGDENVYVDVTVFNYGGSNESDYTVTVNQTGLTTNSISVNVTTLLEEEDSITVAVGPFNTAAGGVVTYNASVVINGATDNIPSNNSGSYQHEAYALSYPVAVDGNRCGFGTVDLGATGITTQFFWYEDSLSTTHIDTGSTFTTDYLYQSDTFWIEGRSPRTEFFAPLTNTFDEGAYYDYYQDGLKFDALFDFTLDAVKVYPQFPGNIVINVLNAQGAVIHTTTYAYNGIATQVTIPLGFDIPQGTGYRINANGTTCELYRNKNTTGSVNAAYPYVLNDVVSITGPINNLFDAYYFFYNWKVTYLGCPSERIPVVATIGDSGFNPTFAVTNMSIPGNGAIATTMSGGVAPYNFTWNTGANSANLTNLFNGTYTVTISDANGCTDTFNVIVLNVVSTNELESVNAFEVFPNPNDGQFSINLELNGTHEVAVEVLNTLGQSVLKTTPETVATRQYPINLKDIPSGLYQIRVRIDDQYMTRSIMVNAKD